jgi:hypothetical protein
VKNVDIRLAVQKSGIRLWQVADALGVADCNFSRKLRHELPADEKEQILKIIERISREAE